MVQNPRAGSWSIPLNISLEDAVGINIGESKSKEAGFGRRKNEDMLHINNSCGWPNRKIFLEFPHLGHGEPSIVKRKA